MVIAVRIIPTPQPMFNLTVDEAHTFFVGEQDWLVHNIDCTEVDLNGVGIDKKVPVPNNCLKPNQCSTFAREFTKSLGEVPSGAQVRVWEVDSLGEPVIFDFIGSGNKADFVDIGNRHYFVEIEHAGIRRTYDNFSGRYPQGWDFADYRSRFQAPEGVTYEFYFQNVTNDNIRNIDLRDAWSSEIKLNR